MVEGTIETDKREMLPMVISDSICVCLNTYLLCKI